jgi:hypothetical protein
MSDLECDCKYNDLAVSKEKIYPGKSVGKSIHKYDYVVSYMIVQICKQLSKYRVVPICVYCEANMMISLYEMMMTGMHVSVCEYMRLHARATKCVVVATVCPECANEKTGGEIRSTKETGRYGIFDEFMRLCKEEPQLRHTEGMQTMYMYIIEVGVKVRLVPGDEVGVLPSMFTDRIWVTDSLECRLQRTARVIYEVANGRIGSMCIMCKLGLMQTLLVRDVMIKQLRGLDDDLVPEAFFFGICMKCLLNSYDNVILPSIAQGYDRVYSIMRTITNGEKPGKMCTITDPTQFEDFYIISWIDGESIMHLDMN